MTKVTNAIDTSKNIDDGLRQRRFAYPIPAYDGCDTFGERDNSVVQTSQPFKFARGVLNWIITCKGTPPMVVESSGSSTHSSAPHPSLRAVFARTSASGVF